MKVVFTPTHYKVEGGVSLYDADNAFNGVDNENPAYINLSGNTSGAFYIDKFRLKGGTWNQYYEDYFYDKKQKWYIKSIVLRVKYGTEEETKPSTASWYSRFSKNTVTFPEESGVETKAITGGPDMYDTSTYNDDAWAYYCTTGEESPYVKFSVPAESGKRILVYGAEVEVEYEDCIPVTFGNFTSPGITYINVRYPEKPTWGRTTISGIGKAILQYTIQNEVVGVPLGSTILFEMAAPKAPRLYVNDVDIADRAEYISGSKIRYVTDPIEEPTDIIATASTMGSMLMAATYEKKNGRWSINDSPRTVIGPNEKYHKC